uniref:NADH dehydrogenase subunit 4L n=1 Tax=Sinergasilus polycolpus TaxID=232557 RepID=C1INF3_SINPO|nr:NADH dehydrogenase subunit 4L [Sinergasilus polycolpus]ACB99582.1 NADH dehydrogenase subunit 4L [Sinergasilus polycolpus]ALG63357.1 NADH dehydrogenase subunit 4L [Sinergasilus polycolpus]
MISLLMFMVVSLLSFIFLSEQLMLIVVWMTIMMLAYAKWRSHLGVVLINLEFFTLIFLYTMFFSLSAYLINMTAVMLLITSLVMEACLGLALLVLMVRIQSTETLISSLN